jgi:hypothetical protein
MRLAAKLGFTEVERFEAYGAEQWFGRWTRSGRPAELTPDGARIRPCLHPVMSPARSITLTCLWIAGSERSRGSGRRHRQPRT